MPLEVRMEFLVRFDKLSHFRNEDIRFVYTTEELLSYFGAGLGLKNAIRFYNKKNILNPYRIINSAVPYYIEYDGDIIMKNHGTIINKYLLDLGKNNT